MASHDWLYRLDSYTNETFGRSASSAVTHSTCVSCGRVAVAFTTDDNVKSYVATGMCEACQNAHRAITEGIVPFNQNYRSE